MKIARPEEYTKIFELRKDVDDFNVKGRQFGLSGNLLWTPNDAKNKTGRFLPYAKEMVDLMVTTKVFKDVTPKKK